ncbi:MAG: thiosulfate oxidation carrier protein SoxY [Hyphomicrobiales bacterium]|nr:MAG: thiosulfate oxidation carrier protein SoxY [Hyphomicrobiales bacterium]
MTTFTRRQALLLGAGAASLAMIGSVPVVFAEGKADEMIKAFTGGAEPATGKVTLDAPEIAENGNTVPVSFTVDSPMTADDHVAAVMVLAEGNPSPAVATFNFSAMSGSANASTRIRLAKTQRVIAIAKMKDGSTYMDAKTVKVTIGGCGG